MRHALEMTINFYCPTFELFCFSFTQIFVYPTVFSSVPPPAVNNRRSLKISNLETSCISGCVRSACSQLLCQVWNKLLSSRYKVDDGNRLATSCSNTTNNVVTSCYELVVINLLTTCYVQVISDLLEHRC